MIDFLRFLFRSSPLITAARELFIQGSFHQYPFFGEQSILQKCIFSAQTWKTLIFPYFVIFSPIEISFMIAK